MRTKLRRSARHGSALRTRVTGGRHAGIQVGGISALRHAAALLTLAVCLLTFCAPAGARAQSTALSRITDSLTGQTNLGPLSAANLTAAAVGPVDSDPPVNTVAPLLSGTSQRTYTLSVTQGTWQGAGNIYAYQWQRSADGTAWSAITGQTATTYTLTQADEGQYVRALVTASNPDGIAAQPSNATAAVVSPYPPANTVPPLVTGTPQRGSLLAATTGTWTGPGLTLSYQWQHDAGEGFEDIPAATTGLYSASGIRREHRGPRRRHRHESRRDGGAGKPADHARHRRRPTNQTAPAFSGNAQRHSTLTASLGSWTGQGNSYAYQWQRSTDGNTWTDLPGATAASYLIAAADEHSQLRVQVTATNPDGSAAAESTPTAVIASAPPVMNAAPALSGSAQRGLTLTATAGAWSGIGNTYTYQWQRSTDGSTWSDVTGATALTYTLAVADENATVRLLVTVTNDDGTVSAPTPASATVIPAPPIKTTDPAVNSAAQRGVALTATPGAFSGIDNAYTYQWQRSIDGTTWTNITGATSTTYTPQVSDEGSQLRILHNRDQPRRHGQRPQQRHGHRSRLRARQLGGAGGHRHPAARPQLIATTGTWSGAATPTPTSGSARPTAARAGTRSAAPPASPTARRRRRGRARFACRSPPPTPTAPRPSAASPLAPFSPHPR